MATLLIPFLIMFGGIIILALTGKAFPMAFWLPTLLCLFAALLLAKKPKQCADAMIRVMANEMVAIMLMACSSRVSLRSCSRLPPDRQPGMALR